MSHSYVQPQPPARMRVARHDDLPALIDLLTEMVPDCLPETVWQLPWSWPTYMVAETPDGLAAAGSLQPVDRGRLEIRGLVVHPSYRGRGLASDVVRELVSRAEQRGQEAVCVTRKPGFFERLGFTQAPPTWMRVERRLYGKEHEQPRMGMVHAGPRGSA